MGVPPFPPGGNDLNTRGQRELDDIGAVFGALAYASRRQILLVLHARGGELTAGDIAARFSRSWPTTTGHLQVLVEAGLITLTRRGRERVYALDVDRLDAVAGEWLHNFAV